MLFFDIHSRPSTKQLDEYKQRIDRIRQNIDPIKLVGIIRIKSHGYTKDAHDETCARACG